MSQQSSALANGFVELPDTDSLDRFLAESNGSPAIIFKHSDTCGISARAHAEMSRIEHSVGLVIVQKARGVAWLRVFHERRLLPLIGVKREV